MKKKWIKRILIIFLTPIILLLLIAICLYFPSVQNLIQKEASSYASEATGLDISIGRVNLYFPLNLVVRNVKVVDDVDTLLSLDRFEVSAQALPLFRGKLEVDKLSLINAKMNTKQLINGVELVGNIGQADLVSRGVDLNNNTVKINHLLLEKSDLKLLLLPTEKDVEEESSEPLDWKIDIEKVLLKQLNFNLEMPNDSLSLITNVANSEILNTLVDLKSETYTVENFNVENSAIIYRSGVGSMSKGFDPSNIQISDLSLSVDSILYSNDITQAKLRNLTFYEKSGLSINRMSTQFKMTEDFIALDKAVIQTPYSLLRADLKFPIDIEDSKINSVVDVDMRISLKEVATVLGVKIEKGNFETWGPVSGEIHMKGNSNRVDIEDFHIELEDAFNFSVVGAILDVNNKSKRQGQLDILGDFYDITRFNDWLSDDGSVLLPKGMVLRGMLALNASDIYSAVEFNEGKGAVNLEARYNLDNEKYKITGDIDSLSILSFMPNIPVQDIITTVYAEGQYIDVMSSKAFSKATISLKSLTYENWKLKSIDVFANLSQGVASTKIISSNEVVKGIIDGKYYMLKPDLSLNYSFKIDELDLYKLKLLEKPIDRKINILGSVETTESLISANLSSEDFSIHINVDHSVESIMKLIDKLKDDFIHGLERKYINFKQIQNDLPKASLNWTIGSDNLISSLLDVNGVKLSSSVANISSSPATGINGLISAYKLKVDSLVLDTVSIKLLQDTTRLELQAGIINKYKGETSSFLSYATAVLNERDASLLLEFERGDKKKALNFGVKVEPKKHGLLFSLIPENPIIGFKKFGYRDSKNKIFIRDDMRVFAEVDMMEDRSVGFRMQSNLTDTISKQNMNVELRRLDLSEVVQIMPFLPDLGGFISAESYYVQTENSLRLSTDVFVDSLTYEKRKIGDFGLGFTWLPISKTEDLVDVYISHNKKDVLFADGNIVSSGKDELIDVHATLSHFPLSVADVIFPNEEIKLDGDIDGEINITGTVNEPKINGHIVLDNVSVYAKQADAYFLFDNRPVKVVDSKIIFKDFSIYTTDKNPFQINGTIDISDMSNPIIDLKLNAKNYPLLNAKRTKESLVYGKMFVDVNATVKGFVDDLKMRGLMSILNNTDVTYVLTESPLTVQDRLGDLVTFTSFNDTISTSKVDSTSLSLGGIDMVMAVHIDPSVVFKVDLSADRSSRVELKGGGDLSLQYNPQTDFSLIGRYTLSGGLIKYSLPIIPSKEFKITTDSYIEWTGKVDDPKLNLMAADRVRASVAESDGSSHMVNFEVIIGAKNKLENLELVFDLKAPENANVQNQLATMSKEERNKQAIGLLATGIYLAGGSDGKSGLDMGAALNSVLQSQINALAGSTLKNASLSVGVEEHDASETGKKRTDYSFSYAQRLWNNRVQIIIGGRVKTGEEVSNDLESIIDNVSIEYRLDASGTRYVRVFHNKNYESILEGEITETGVGLVLRKKLNRLGELFIFKKKKKNDKSNTN